MSEIAVSVFLRSADHVHLNDDLPEALNWTTGETVAIKKISLSDIPKAELGDIMVSGR